MFNSKRFLTDSRTFIYYFKKGHLQGYDNNSNIILSQSFERVFSSDQGVQTVDLGLYLIKGDNLLVSLYQNSYVFSLQLQSMRFRDRYHD